MFILIYMKHNQILLMIFIPLLLYHVFTYWKTSSSREGATAEKASTSGSIDLAKLAGIGGIGVAGQEEAKKNYKLTNDKYQMIKQQTKIKDIIALKDFVLKFTVKPIKARKGEGKSGWANIIHVTETGTKPSCEKGYWNPSVWFFPNKTSLFIGLSGTKCWRFKGKKVMPSLPIGKGTTVVISVIGTKMKVKMTGGVSFNDSAAIDAGPRPDKKKCSVFIAGGGTYNAPAIAQIKNVTWSNGAGADKESPVYAIMSGDNFKDHSIHSTADGKVKMESGKEIEYIFRTPSHSRKIGTVSIRIKGEDKWLSHKDYFAAFLPYVDTENWKKNASWTIMPAPKGRGCQHGYWIRNVGMSNRFLRHQGYVVKLHSTPQSGVHLKDACWVFKHISGPELTFKSNTGDGRAVVQKLCNSKNYNYGSKNVRAIKIPCKPNNCNKKLKTSQYVDMCWPGTAGIGGPKGTQNPWTCCALDPKAGSTMQKNMALVGKGCCRFGGIARSNWRKRGNKTKKECLGICSGDPACYGVDFGRIEKGRGQCTVYLNKEEPSSYDLGCKKSASTCYRKKKVKIKKKLKAETGFKESEKYMIGTKGSLCKLGSRINSHSECQEAIKGLNFGITPWATTNEVGLPAGCSYAKNQGEGWAKNPIGGKMSHWNSWNKSTGKPRSDLYPVCKKSVVTYTKDAYVGAVLKQKKAEEKAKGKIKVPPKISGGTDAQKKKIQSAEEKRIAKISLKKTQAFCIAQNQKQGSNGVAYSTVRAAKIPCMAGNCNKHLKGKEWVDMCWPGENSFDGPKGKTNPWTCCVVEPTAKLKDKIKLNKKTEKNMKDSGELQKLALLESGESEDSKSALNQIADMAKKTAKAAGLKAAGKELKADYETGYKAGIKFQKMKGKGRGGTPLFDDGGMNATSVKARAAAISDRESILKRAKEIKDGGASEKPFKSSQKRKKGIKKGKRGKGALDLLGREFPPQDRQGPARSSARQQGQQPDDSELEDRVRTLEDQINVDSAKKSALGGGSNIKGIEYATGKMGWCIPEKDAGGNVVQYVAKASNKQGWSRADQCISRMGGRAQLIPFGSGNCVKAQTLDDCNSALSDLSKDEYWHKHNVLMRPDATGAGAGAAGAAGAGAAGGAGKKDPHAHDPQKDVGGRGGGWGGGAGNADDGGGVQWDKQYIGDCDSQQMQKIIKTCPTSETRSQHSQDYAAHIKLCGCMNKFSNLKCKAPGMEVGIDKEYKDACSSERMQRLKGYQANLSFEKKYCKKNFPYLRKNPDQNGGWNCYKGPEGGRGQGVLGKGRHITYACNVREGSPPDGKWAYDLRYDDCAGDAAAKLVK
jgi:hypothetical protein